ncbi:Hypothetical protein, conserved [Brucella canis ATCC 23365]|uniref:Uncharacterized protein n=2 Tax=Brucella TaxID=234 RepID=A9MBZ2_BRUC2|nr:Hypothetical protein, conserved [Brucella canis ATCC 23365]ABY39668.1 Hypothetical protein, conserved [Brucella suis ATCC 23445]
MPIMLAVKTRRTEFACGATASATVIISYPVLRAVKGWENWMLTLGNEAL